MTPEDRAAHDKFSEGIIRSLAPEGELELQLAQRIATDSWRLNRASAIEDNLFALGHSKHAGETGDQHSEIEAAFAAAKTRQSESRASNRAPHPLRSAPRPRHPAQPHHPSRRSSPRAKPITSVKWKKPPVYSNSVKRKASAMNPPKMGSFFQTTRSAPPPTASAVSPRPNPPISTVANTTHPRN